MSNLEESPEVSMSPQMYTMLEIMVDAGITGGSYFELVEAGIDDPDDCAAQLRKAGVVIKVKERPAIHSCGMLWDDISHYIYKRWI